MKKRQKKTTKGFGIQESRENSKKMNNTLNQEDEKSQSEGIFKTTIKPLLEIGNIKKAEPALRLLAQADSKYSEIYEALYSLGLQEKNKKESEYWRKKWLNTRAQNKKAGMKQVEELKRAGEERLQITLLERVLSIDPNDDTIKISLLDNFLENERWDKARKFIKESFTDKHLGIEVLWRSAWLEFETDNKQELIAINRKIDKVIKGKGNSAEQSIVNKYQCLRTVEFNTKENKIKDKEYWSILDQVKNNWPENRIISIWLFKQEKRNNMALELTQKAMERQKNSGILLKQKAVLNLRLGKWQKGFKDLLKIDKKERYDPNNEVINIISHESMGDSLLWSRWISQVEDIEGKKIKLHIQPPLVAFMKRNLKSKVQISSKPMSTNQNHNNLMVLSLPGFQGWQPELLKKLPLWVADETIKAQWSKKLRINACKPLIALNWHGSALNAAAENENTDIPLSEMKPPSTMGKDLFELIGVQKGIGTEELEKCNFKDRFINQQDQVKMMNTLDQLAAVLSLCDWLICDDSGPAHMAGCLGIKTIVCLPETTNWRWPASENTPPWYPNTIMIRKSKNQNWRSCLEKAWEIVEQSLISKTNT